MAKLLLVGRQDWEQNGSIGSSIIAVKKDGKVIKFSATRERADELEGQIHEGEVDYDEDRAVEISIKIKEFAGKVKFQDALSEWPEGGTN